MNKLWTFNKLPIYKWSKGRENQEINSSDLNSCHVVPWERWPQWSDDSRGLEETSNWGKLRKTEKSPPTRNDSSSSAQHFFEFSFLET